MLSDWTVCLFYVADFGRFHVSSRHFEYNDLIIADICNVDIAHTDSQWISYFDIYCAAWIGSSLLYACQQNVSQANKDPNNPQEGDDFHVNSSHIKKKPTTVWKHETWSLTWEISSDEQWNILN